MKHLRNLNKNILDLSSKERRWLMLEGSFLQQLSQSVASKNLASARRAEKFCARIHRRGHTFVQKIKSNVKLYEYMKEYRRFWSTILNQLELYDRNLTAKVANPLFGEKGKISQLLQNNHPNWDELQREVDEAYSKGVIPLLAILDSLEQYIKEQDILVESKPLVETAMEGYSAYGREVIRTSVLPETKKIVEEYLKSVFPKTYKPVTLKNLIELGLGKRFNSLEDNFKIHYWHNKKDKSSFLLSLATLFGPNYSPIQPDKALETIRKRLVGRKILSLGDDTGSFSEILQHFGCHTLGIEFDKDKVALAHTGKLSEDGRPRLDIIQGDIWELLLPESALATSLKSYKFDAIVSYALFNGGSGGEYPNEHVEDLIRNRYPELGTIDQLMGADTNFFNPLFPLLTSRFLKRHGLQLHTLVEIQYPFGLHQKLEIIFKNYPKIRRIRKEGYFTSSDVMGGSDVFYIY